MRSNKDSYSLAEGGIPEVFKKASIDMAGTSPSFVIAGMALGGNTSFPSLSKTVPGNVDGKASVVSENSVPQVEHGDKGLQKTTGTVSAKDLVART